MSAEDRISRRHFLGQTLLAGAAAIAIAGRVPCPDFAEAQGLAPGKKKLIIRSLRFYDLETPVNLFDTFITPVDLFFVRNHMSEPTEFDADTYRLRVMGEVEHPLELSLRELKKMQASTVINTLECAGDADERLNPGEAPWLSCAGAHPRLDWCGLMQMAVRNSRT